MNRRKAFIVSNLDTFFLANRKEQGQVMQEKGYEVHVLAADTGRSGEITKMGFIYHELPMARYSLNPFLSIKSIKDIRRIYQQESPVVIHHLGLKVIMLGTLAAMKTGAAVFNTYTGLGYLFTVDTWKTKFFRSILIMFSRWLYRRKKVVAIFQNMTDFNLFKKYKVIDEKNGFVIKGCGVNMEEYSYAPMPDQQPLKIILPGKMLSSKGIYDFVEVAKAIKNDASVTHEVEFMLCGGIEEGHPFSAKKEEVEHWHNQGWVNWAGFQKDMMSVYKMADVVMLPSWREGMPKGLLEAGSVGRPIITYDVAGCSEAVEDGVSGYVVPFGDVKLLTERTRTLIMDRNLRVQMGENSRQHVLRHFETYKIIEENLALYNKFL